MSKSKKNMNKGEEKTDFFDKKEDSLNKLKMFVKRSCKPELITNLNDTDIEEEIELLPQGNNATGSSSVRIVV